MTDTPQPPENPTPAAAPAPAPTPTPRLTVPSTPTTQLPGPRLVTVNGVNWQNILEFTHLFRGFRLAINPAKILLALLAILAIYLAGLLFDFVWGGQVNGDEIQQFATESPELYRSRRTDLKQNRTNALSSLLSSEGVIGEERETLSKDHSRAYKRLKQEYYKNFEEELKKAADDRAAAEKLAASPQPPDAPPRVAPLLTPEMKEQEGRKSASNTLFGNMSKLEATMGAGIFDTFFKFELGQFDRLVDNTLSIIRVGPVRADEGAISTSLITRDSERLWRSDTLAGCIANMAVTGPKWLLTGTAPMQAQPGDSWARSMMKRGLYLATLLLFALFSILIIAFTGASIARLSALELAGIERPPLKDVFLFAFRRLWVFIKAPLMPFIIMLAFGLVIGGVSLIGAIPWVGPIVIGALFFVALAVCFVLMLLLLGVLGGFNLLYPTIAVEGADAFDAMSRSFAYVYSRPWRLLFYTIISLFYGVLTFLFVSFAVYLILLLAYTFVGWGMNFFGMNYGDYSGVPQLQSLWPKPEYLRLSAEPNWYALSWSEWIGAKLLHLWVFILTSAIAGYVVSYYFSSQTITYLLLRRSVDGQGLQDVYTEQ